MAEYQQLHPDIKIDYQAIGSGGGIKDITEKTVNFAGSDAPMSKTEIAAAGGPANLVEIPSCAGGVVPAYNVPGVSRTSSSPANCWPRSTWVRSAGGMTRRSPSSTPA